MTKGRGAYSSPLFLKREKMRLSKGIILSLIAAFVLAACSGNKKQEQEPQQKKSLLPPHIDFTAEDSSAIRLLAREYLACFEAKDYDNAAAMLYKLQNDSIVELSSTEREKFLKTIRQLPNYGTKMKGFSLYTETNNRLIYLLQVTSGGNLDTEEGIMRFYLNPVRRDGKWYLTLFDPEAEGTRSVY